MTFWFLLACAPGVDTVQVLHTADSSAVESTGDEEADDTLSMTEAELLALAQEFYDGNETVIEMIGDTDDLEYFVEAVGDIERTDDELSAAPVPPPLAGCSGWWGGDASEYTAYWANYNSGASTSPNCFQTAESMGDEPCGDDSDDVVSFWLGSGYSTSFKVYSTSSYTRAWLYLKQKTKSSSAKNTRLYEYGGEGNAYVCLPPSHSEDKLRFGW